MTVFTERVGAACVVTLQRPERRNAVDPETAAALHAAFLAFEETDAPVAVLTGAGGAFCAGFDLTRAAGIDADWHERHAVRDEAALSDHRIAPMGPTRMRLAKPVIAAVEGPAVAGGLELALWCDLRVAAEDAYFGVYCRRWGVPLIDGGAIRLPRLIGGSRAMDLILTGRRVDAPEAEAIGLVNRLAPPGGALAAALALAEELARFPQACMNADREVAKAQWGLDRAAAFAREWRSAATFASEGVAGAARFSGGRGRGGDFEEI